MSVSFNRLHLAANVTLNVKQMKPAAGMAKWLAVLTEQLIFCQTNKSHTLRLHKHQHTHQHAKNNVMLAQYSCRSHLHFQAGKS